MNVLNQIKEFEWVNPGLQMYLPLLCSHYLKQYDKILHYIQIYNIIIMTKEFEFEFEFVNHALKMYLPSLCSHYLKQDGNTLTKEFEFRSVGSYRLWHVKNSTIPKLCKVNEPNSQSQPLLKTNKFYLTRIIC